MKVLIQSVMMALIAALVIPTTAWAQAVLPSGNTPVDMLQTRCNTILPTLRRLHTSDGLLRVNVSQSYNALSVHLMARLNSRLALHRIDSTQLVEIAQRFETSRQRFSQQYTTYDTAMSHLVKVSCASQPTEFYAALIIARDARHKVSTAVKQLHDDIQAYRVAAEDVLRQLEQQSASSGGAA